jgi:uncharacterized protein YjdB
VGGTRQFSASATDEFGNPCPEATFTWSSSNTAVATVSSAGLATAVAAGSAEIRASTENLTGTAPLTVQEVDTDPEVAAVVIAPSGLTLEALEQKAQLTASAEDSSGNPLSGITIVWSTLNSSVAVVDQMGVVTAKAVGTVLIVASASCCQAADTVTVEVTQIAAEVAVSPSSRTLAEGASYQFSAVVKDAMEYVIPGLEVTWSSANSGIATVSSAGNVHGVAAGSTEIRASFSGLEGSSQVTVEAAAEPPPPPANAPELPRLLPDTTMPALRDTVVVTSNLQAAIDAATSGTLLLVQGEHVGNFRVRSGAASGVQIQGGRLVTSNTSPAIRFESGVSRWKMVDTEIRTSASHTGALVSIEGGDRITLQNVDVHVHDGATTQRCVLGNGTHVSVLNSSLTGCKHKGFDSQAFVAWNGAGPYWLQGNLLEGAGENVMFGGADSASPDDLPADITIRNNVMRKPPEWFQSKAWSVKNLFEIKAATRVLVEDNLLENSWADAQNVAVLIYSVNQGGSAPWSKATDIVFRGNTIRNFNIGMNLAAAWTGQPVAEVLSRVLIEDNMFENGGRDNPYFVSGAARAIMILNDIRDLTIRHNEWHGQYVNQVVFEGGGKVNFIFMNNIVGESSYGFQNAHQLYELAPDAIVQGSILAPAVFNTSLPSGNCIVWPPASATGCPDAGGR